MKRLEENLEKLVKFIKKYVSENSFPPTVRDMCEELSISSTSTIFYYLNKLEERNLIRRSKSKNRAIELIQTDLDDPVPSNITRIPLIGNIAAGIPILAQENLVENFDFSKTIFCGDGLFMLTVHGDSMIDVGIMNGDFIVVRKQETAENGEIVVALIDDSATVKTFYKEKNNIRLQPENPLYKPIITQDVSILGKVVGVIRKV